MTATIIVAAIVGIVAAYYLGRRHAEASANHYFEHLRRNTAGFLLAHVATHRCAGTATINDISRFCKDVLDADVRIVAHVTKEALHASDADPGSN